MPTIRRKRGDTYIETIEEKYHVELNARGDMLLSNLLAERGFDSLSQLLNAYHGNAKYSTIKRRLFLSFHMNDLEYAMTFKSFAQDSDGDISFYDQGVKDPVNSENSAYMLKE